MDASGQWSHKVWSIFFNVLLISWLLLSDSENNVILGYVPMIFYCHNYISWSENKMVLLLFYISVLNVTQNVIFLQRIVRFYQLRQRTVQRFLFAGHEGNHWWSLKLCGNEILILLHTISKWCIENFRIMLQI